MHFLLLQRAVDRYRGFHAFCGGDHDKLRIARSIAGDENPCHIGFATQRGVDSALAGQLAAERDGNRRLLMLAGGEEQGVAFQPCPVSEGDHPEAAVVVFQPFDFRFLDADPVTIEPRARGGRVPPWVNTITSRPTDWPRARPVTGTDATPSLSRCSQPSHGQWKTQRPVAS